MEGREGWAEANSDEEAISMVFSCEFSFYISCSVAVDGTGQEPERSKAKRGRESHALALLAEAHTDIWQEREDLGTSLLLCPGKMFRQGN